MNFIRVFPHSTFTECCSYEFISDHIIKTKKGFNKTLDFKIWVFKFVQFSLWVSGVQCRHCSSPNLLTHFQFWGLSRNIWSLNNHYNTVTLHLLFNQTQPKMCHSRKVEDRVENKFFTSWTHLLGQFLLKNLELPYILNC